MKNNLLKKSAILVILFTLLSLTIMPILQGSTERPDQLDIMVYHPDPTTIQLMVSVPSCHFDEEVVGNDHFTCVDIDDIGRTSIEGQANLPMIRKMIEIPQGSIPEIITNDITWEPTSLKDLHLPGLIIPVQSFIDKVDNDDTIWVMDDEYYQTNSFLPVQPVVIDQISEIRGRRFALIEIAPVLYNPVSGQLQLLVSADITVDLSNGYDETQTIECIQRYSSPSFEEAYAQIFSNYGYYEDMVEDSKDAEGYLIIAYDNFLEEITPLATWKTSKGYEVTVTLSSEIPDGPTTSNIKAYIEDAYETWPTPPSYILLVGDTGQLPAFTSDGGATDTPFVTIDGDAFQDIYIGRFPAALEDQVTAMVDKTIYYEQGVFPSTDWIKKATFMASVDNYDISEGTHNYVIDTHLEPNGYACDRLYQVTYGATTQDVRDALNDGRSLAIYSGHGSTTSWSDGPPFSKTDVNGLTNEGMYPFVCSHACKTGQFSLSECFGETWVRAADKAAIAFWGSSINTQWIPDDIIERRVFDAWWDLGLDKIGQMTDKGMYDAYMEYGSGMGKYIKSYNILGDASLTILSGDQPNFDINQDISDRGFPIRHALDGDWAAAQSFDPTFDMITGVDIYLRRFGTPEFDLTVELRQDHPEGVLLDTQVFTVEQTPTSWYWFSIDFTDTVVSPGIDYFIVIPPAPSGVTTSFGYEWSYAFGNKYDGGSFWFTRDGGGLWRDLPASYEFTFRTY